MNEKEDIEQRLRDVEQRLRDVEQRLQTVEDVEAIKKLKYQYCAYCDDNYNADGIASLFTEDAIWDGGTFGRYEGREAICCFFRSAPRLLSFAAHQVMNPIIDVQGDKARAIKKWRFFGR
jgi:hypothetical protein